MLRYRALPTTLEYARAAAKSVIAITEDIAPEILDARNRLFTDYDFQRIYNALGRDTGSWALVDDVHANGKFRE